MKVVFVTNIPAPYREKVYELVSDNVEIDLEVFYCSESESNREWSFKRGNYKSQFLESQRIVFAGRDLYLFSNIWKRLSKTRPDIVMVAGFSVPMLLAYVWATFHRKKVVSFTDAHIRFERRLTIFHRILRKVFYNLSSACVGASNKSLELYKSYGIREEKLFQSHLCADNYIYNKEYKEFPDRNYDIIVCGRISSEKLFDFSAEVINEIKKAKHDLKVLVVGDGPDREKFLEALTNSDIEFEYAGFVSQEELPKLYSNAKVFLFPSKNDAWGVVANESCASGTPVISCLEVGAAGELLLDSVNSKILLLDKSVWAEQALELIRSPEVWESYSLSALREVKNYTYQNAADGLINAFRFAAKRG